MEDARGEEGKVEKNKRPKAAFGIAPELVEGPSLTMNGGRNPAIAVVEDEGGNNAEQAIDEVDFGHRVYEDSHKMAQEEENERLKATLGIARSQARAPTGP